LDHSNRPENDQSDPISRLKVVHFEVTIGGALWVTADTAARVKREAWSQHRSADGCLDTAAICAGVISKPGLHPGGGKD